ncbi:hypothetical protein ACJX0J_033056 [Zea mays]
MERRVLWPSLIYLEKQYFVEDRYGARSKSSPKQVISVRDVFRFGMIAVGVVGKLLMYSNKVRVRILDIFGKLIGVANDFQGGTHFSTALDILVPLQRLASELVILRVGLPKGRKRP